MKPHPTYYFGRKVVSVNVPKKGDEWEIEFQGGVVFKNQAKKVKAPTDDIVGTSLLTVDDSVLKFGTANGDGVRITAEVSMTPGEWTISDPQERIETGEHVQGLEVADAESDTPPDPSAERVADGPTVDPEAEQEAEDDTDAEG